MSKLFKINENDNVAIALEPLKMGFCADGITLLSDVPLAHKVLLTDLKAGDKVIKYGYPIGSVTEDLKKGSWVHTHNLKTDLTESGAYSHIGKYYEYSCTESNDTFMGYERENGDVGVRNDIWIIPTVGCINKVAERLCEIAREVVSGSDINVKVFTHPYGCAQAGDDHVSTQKILAALVNHPNAGGVLVVSLGCEYNNVDAFKPLLGEINENRVKFLVTQNEEDELERGRELLFELAEYTAGFKRVPIPASKLIVGFKCGGSDAFSGITANAVCGRFTDKLTDAGGSAILTEVPEMFGAEQILMARAENENVFNDTVDLINDFKHYFTSQNIPVYENPAPGNKDGGISTLEEKSLGCVQKGGRAVVTDVIPYGGRCNKKGLSLLNGPGNDIVSITALAAAGAHIVLFTTGRGTPLGAPVPTVKISSNTALYERKKNWIDFNAGDIMSGASLEEKSKELFDLVLDVASGRQTRNEINGYSEIAIFKNGVTM